MLAVLIDTLVWSEVKTAGKSPCPRERHSMTNVGGKLYVFGGLSKASEFMNDLYSLDLMTLRWTSLKFLHVPVPRNHHAAVSIDEKLYIIGGKSQHGYFNDVHCFDESLKQWSQPHIETMCPAGRWGHNAVSIGHRIIIFGGWNGTWCFDDLHCYDTSKMDLQRYETRKRAIIV